MDSHKIQKNSEKIIQKIFHPIAIISQQTIIGSGTMLGPGTIVGLPLFKLETLLSINRGVRIGHHTKIGDFCTLKSRFKYSGWHNYRPKHYHRNGC